MRGLMTPSAGCRDSAIHHTFSIFDKCLFPNVIITDADFLWLSQKRRTAFLCFLLDQGGVIAAPRGEIGSFAHLTPFSLDAGGRLAAGITQ